jgi:radical SAM superfamily enzyme YgiQ (UPF0313 family)
VKVVDEIDRLVSLGVRHFFIADDSMISDENFVLEFADEIGRRELSIKFKIACRADKLTPTIADALKRSGCYEAHVGFESGSQKVLDALGKKLKVADNIRAAETLHNAGIRVYALMILGSTGEDVQSLNETIDFLNRIRPDAMATMGGLMLLPGTRDYQRAVKEGLLNDDFWLGADPFMYYTKNFSRPELILIGRCVEDRRHLWRRRLLHLQFALYYPADYAQVMNVGRLYGRFLRVYSLLPRGLRYLRRKVGGGR